MAALQNKVWDDLLTEFPVLMDPKDLHFGDRKMRSHHMRRLLEKCNRISRIPFTMDALKKKLRTIHRTRTRRRRRQDQSGEDSRGDGWLDQETCSEPTNQSQRVTLKKPEQQTALFTMVFHCCRVCGEIKGDCSKGIDKCYIVINKTTLALNGMSIELDFDKDTMVCQSCDVKLKDLYEFVKLVSTAQYELGKKIANIDLTENEMPIDDYDVGDQKLVIDSLTATDTEFVKPTVLQKRKCEETPEAKKKCRVTIDLNISDDEVDNSSTMDDIEAKYQMFKKGEVSHAKSAKRGSKAVTENVDAILELKKKIEQDMHKVNETKEVTYADRNDIKSKLRSNRKYENSEDVILDVKKEIVSDDILNEVNETGETATDDDNINDAGTDRTCDSDKTQAITGETSDLANRGEPMCVMPQSDLIQLVESIVSRMLNK